MKKNNMAKLAASVVFVALAALIAAPGALFYGCVAPVSDEAIVSVEGQVLDVDGTPMSNVVVRLVKSDINVLDADWVIGAIVNADNTPFRQVSTDSEGYFHFEFEGAQANSKNQMWAAYFVAYVLYPADPDDHMGVATDTFQFSNQKLDIVLDDLAFWDIPAGGVTVDDNFVTIDFAPSDVEPEHGKYLLHVDGTDWTAEVEGHTYSLPLTALEPCQNPVKNGPEECVPKKEHRLQIISLGDGMRYRTAWYTFEAQNPRGVGLWYRDPDANTSGSTCSDKVLFDLNDGKHSGAGAVQYLGNGLLTDDLRCFTIDLQQPYYLEEVYIHAASVWFHKNAFIVVEVTTSDAPVESDWLEIAEYDGSQFVWPMVSWRIGEIYEDARMLRVRFLDAGGADAVWEHIGEITVYGVPEV